jgi:hypothetical protein
MARRDVDGGSDVLCGENRAKNGGGIMPGVFSTIGSGGGGGGGGRPSDDDDGAWRASGSISVINDEAVAASVERPPCGTGSAVAICARGLLHAGISISSRLLKKSFGESRMTTPDDEEVTAVVKLAAAAVVAVADDVVVLVAGGAAPGGDPAPNTTSASWNHLSSFWW